MQNLSRYVCALFLALGVCGAVALLFPVAVQVAVADPAAPDRGPVQPADLILRDGAVYTLDAVRSWARAIAVRDGSIVHVGSDETVRPFIGEQTRVVDLGGRMVLPAFQDVHIHPISGGLRATRCELGGMQTEKEYLEAIAEYAAAHPEEAWIQGGGWAMDAFPAGIPSKRGLDKIVSDRPVSLRSTDGHSAWVNSKALEIAGITRDTPDPPDGRIDRDPETGEPVGALQEGAMRLVGKHITPPTLEERADALRYSLRMLNGYGITSIQDASASEESLITYRHLDERGELTARVVASQWWERGRGTEQIPEMIERRERFTKGRLRAETVKIMQDGVMENFTAVVLEPYIGKPGVYGIPMVDPEALKEIVTQLDRERFQVHFHAIGDGAIRQALDAIEAARKKNGDSGRLHHISHIELFDPEDIPRFRELKVAANFQPLWAYADNYITDLTIPFIGSERSRWLYPIGSLLRSGAVIAFGSDWSVSTANPFEEIEVAVTRMGANGETTEPFLPDERINLPSALAAFTINAAYVNSLEEKTGSIEVGKLADLVVLDRNLFAIEPTEISETNVLLTLLEGQPVHGDFSLEKN
ncbi:MAG: amidohydrolase family protein [Acidobacteriota bacterium]|nr:amidohydrolase family protein [Acidobacteriota bacterium]